MHACDLKSELTPCEFYTLPMPCRSLLLIGLLSMLHNVKIIQIVADWAQLP